MTYEVMKARVGAIKKLERVLMRSLSEEEKNYVTENGIVQFLNDYLKIPLERWELMVEIQSYIADYFTADAESPEASQIVLEELKKIYLANANKSGNKSTTSVKIGDPENLGTKIRYPEDTNQCSDEDLIQGCKFDSNSSFEDSALERLKRGEPVTSSLEKVLPLYTKAIDLLNELPDFRGIEIFSDNDNAKIVLLK